MSFTPSQVALLEANSDAIGAVALVELDFADGMVRLTDAPRDLVIGGVTWASVVSGGRCLLDVSDVPSPRFADAGALTYTLHAAGPLVQAALGNRAAFYGRTASLGLQFLAAGEPVGPRIVLHRGRMQAMTGRISDAEASVSLVVESVLTRMRWQGTYYSDVDQRARVAGDRGFEFLPGIQRGAVLRGWLFA